MSSLAAFPTIQSRIEKSAKILKVPEKDIIDALDGIGITANDDGLALLNANTTVEDFLINELMSSEVLQKDENLKQLKVRAVAAVLKGRDPFAAPKAPEHRPVNVVKESESVVSAVAEAIKATRDIKQLKDRELLELYDKERDYEVEQELHRRAGYQHFVVLKPKTDESLSSCHIDRKEIDLEASLELLKLSRKRTNPTIVPQDGRLVNVYRITELNPEDQVVEICPFCGEITYKGYCEACESDLSPLGHEERIFVKVIVDVADEKLSRSDRRDVLNHAGKGIDNLRVCWPKAAREYDRLKLADELPKLRKLKTLPSQRPADPFRAIVK